MALIQNEGRRAYGLPGRIADAGAVAAFLLAPTQSVEVPDWYVAELLEEPGTADLLSRGELAVIDAEPPPAAAPPPRLEVRHDAPVPFADPSVDEVRVAPSKKRRRGTSAGRG